MANSIFLGPNYSGTAADTPRSIEEKLNADFSALYAKNPDLTGLQRIKMTYSTDDGVPDSLEVTQAKINSMLAALGARVGLTAPQVDLDSRTGLDWRSANLISTTLQTLDAYPALNALGLSTTAVTRTQAFTANITGATATSTLAGSGLPSGLTVNSGARTITGTTSVTAGSYPIVVTETLAGHHGSPRSNSFTLVVT